MIKLASHRELRQEMGRKGFQRIVGCFDWKVKVDKMLEIYKEAINRYASNF